MFSSLVAPGVDEDTAAVTVVVVGEVVLGEGLLNEVVGVCARGT